VAPKVNLTHQIQSAAQGGEGLIALETY